MSSFIVIIIAVSLSMDAFSLSLAYGTLNINKKDSFKLSIIVGIYHFFMPVFGNIIGNKIIDFFKINPNLIICFVLCFIGFQMILEHNDKNEIKPLNITNMLLFGFAVSLDSFSIGIGLNHIYDNILFSTSVFSIFSFLFTYLGLLLGTKIRNSIGNIATMLGGISLIIIGFLYII